MYDLGQGVVQDYKEAAKWDRKSAEQGLAAAQFALGAMYANGDGVFGTMSMRICGSILRHQVVIRML